MSKTKTNLDELIDSFSNQEELQRQSILFFQDNKIMTNGDINNTIFMTYCASKKIKYVEAFVDKTNNKISVVVYLNRSTYLFISHKKMLKNIEECIRQTLPKFIDLQINIEIYKKYDK